MLKAILRKTKGLFTKRRPNRNYSVGNSSNRQFDESRISSVSSGSKNDAVSLPPDIWDFVGFDDLTNIKNKETLRYVISYVTPTIFNKEVIDSVIRNNKIIEDEGALKKLSYITMIFLKDIEITPIVMRLLEIVVEKSFVIDKIVLINIPLTLELLNLIRRHEFMTKVLILRNIKFPNEDKTVFLYKLIKWIEAMKVLEVLDFSGFNICDIDRNKTFAKLFNNLILTLSGNLKFLNFTNNFIDYEEYMKIFNYHLIQINHRKYNTVFSVKTNKKTENITFERWNVLGENTSLIIYNDTKENYRSIYINASPNFVDIKRETLILDDIVLKNREVRDQIDKIIGKTGGRKIKNKKTVKKPVNNT